MKSLVDQGFVTDDGLEFQYIHELRIILLSGKVRCLGGIEVSVYKEIALVEGDGPTALVRTTKYSYHCHLTGGPNILRYDSPVAHRDFHHKHLFDTFGDNRELDVTALQDEQSIPTLYEVIKELQNWYWEYREKIARL